MLVCYHNHRNHHNHHRRLCTFLRCHVCAESTLEARMMAACGSARRRWPSPRPVTTALALQVVTRREEQQQQEVREECQALWGQTRPPPGTWPAPLSEVACRAAGGGSHGQLRGFRGLPRSSWRRWRRTTASTLQLSSFSSSCRCRLSLWRRRRWRLLS